jgi:NADH-quinone oxidoreductase subunit K
MISSGVILIGAGIFVFFIGVIQCLTSRHFLGYLLGIELIINSANVNLAGFLQIQPYRTNLQPLIIMIIAFAAIEVCVGLSLFSWISKEEKKQDFKIL